MSIMDNRTTLFTVIVVWVAAGVVGGVAGPANADFYKFTFGGEIFVLDGIVPEPWDDVHIGSEYEFWYIFDSEAEDHAAADFIGLYYTLGGEVIIDGVSQATDEGSILIIDDWIGQYFAYLKNLPIGAGASIQLAETNILDSDDLLLDIDLDDWNAAQVQIIGDGFTIRGDVTSFVGGIVPTPGAVSLMAMFLCVKRRRRRVD